MLGLLDDFLERRARARGHEGWTAALLLSPAVAVLGLFGVAPLFAAFQLSLCGGKFAMGGYVGLDNYARVLHNPAFWKSAEVTAYYALGTIPLSLTLSFLAAWFLFRIEYARSLFRTAYFLPYITPVVAAAMVWRALLNPRSGPLNALLAGLGLPAQQWVLEPRGILHILTGGLAPPEWGPSLALCCIIAFDVWHSLGYGMLVFLAGLSAIPRELEDAARIDGAGTVQVLRRITLPLLAPLVLFLLIVGGIRAFQSFNSFYALSQGGARALGTTENLVIHIYSNFYEYGDWGYGAAVAVLLSGAIAALSVLQWRLWGARTSQR